MRFRTVLAVTVASGTFAFAASANSSVIWAGSSGNLHASVEFALSGSNLLVTLTNTSTADTLVPADLLNAVFFDVDGDPALTRTSGVLAPGSSVFYDGDGQPAGGVIGGEWAYANGLNQYGANSGISSTGLGIFGPSNVFAGANLAGPAEPDGPQYGLLSAGDNALTGNGGITGSGGLIRNSVVFTLGGLPGGFSLDRISHDRWFLDRIATHILAFEGNSEVVWHEGNFQSYVEDLHKRKGADADQPHRVAFKKLVRT
jgi:hypothetical protein